MQQLKLFLFVLILFVTHSSFANVPVTVWWGPSVSYSGSTDPFVGDTSDSSLAQAGNLSQTGLSRLEGNSAARIWFGDVPSTFNESFYIEFSVIPGANQSLELPDLILQGAEGQGLAVDYSDLVLRSEFDGYTNDISAQAASSNLQGNSGRPVSFDLDFLPTVTEEIGFRLYPSGMNLNQFYLTGIIAVPGPGGTSGGMWFANVIATPIPESSNFVLYAAFLSVVYIFGGRKRVKGHQT